MITLSLCGGLALVWLLDLASYYDPHDHWANRLPLLFGPLAAAALLFPARGPGPEWRAGALALGSLALTAGLWAYGPLDSGTWGVLENVALLVLLARTARRVERPATALILSVGLAAAVILAPLRLEPYADTVTACFLLTLAVGAAAGLACYLRLLDARRTRAVAAVRQGERLELARDLHDFVAHHVTGIVVLAQAASTIQKTAPEQIEPILKNIEQSGAETLETMRRLVRVLREGEHRGVRPGELLPELARLVSWYAEEGARAQLDASTEARAARLAPEVETSVHRVVQEALTNVRRHAPGADVTVRLDVEAGGAGTDGMCLRVDVRNTLPTVRAATPAGGRGGFGLIGLGERVEAVDGTLRAGPTAEGGWEVTAHFPAMTGSLA